MNILHLYSNYIYCIYVDDFVYILTFVHVILLYFIDCDIEHKCSETYIL